MSQSCQCFRSGLENEIFLILFSFFFFTLFFSRLLWLRKDGAGDPLIRVRILCNTGDTPSSCHTISPGKRLEGRLRAQRCYRHSSDQWCSATDSFFSRHYRSPIRYIIVHKKEREKMREKRNVSAQCLNYEGKHLLWLGMGLSILVLVPSVGLFRDRQTWRELDGMEL